MGHNEYIPFQSEIIEVIKHTDIEYTFRMAYDGEIKPGQFFQVSIPKFGEAPISVSGIEDGLIDLTIRRVGKVTNEIFENYVGDKLFLRGPYGNGFNVDDYKDKEIIVITGGTGLSPVKGVIDYFSANPEKAQSFTLIAGFKSVGDILFKNNIKKWEKTMKVVITVDKDADKTCKVGLVTAHIPDIVVNNIAEAVAIVVGPQIMMDCSVHDLLEIGVKQENIWISQERKMACGIGKCGHCKIDDVYTCLEGPVFNYTKGKQLRD